MYNSKIDWSKLTPKTERTTYIQTSIVEKLDSGIFVCPECWGSGKVTVIYRDPGPNKMGICWTCYGIGEVIRCEHPECGEPVPNTPNYPSKLCHKHLKEKSESEWLDVDIYRLRRVLNEHRH